MQKISNTTLGVQRRSELRSNTQAEYQTMVVGMSHGYKMDQPFSRWRILFGAFIIVFVYVGGLFGVGFFIHGRAGFDLNQPSQVTLMVFLASFIPIWLATGAVTSWVMGFSLPHLYGRMARISWRDFKLGFFYVLGLVLVIEAVVCIVTWSLGSMPYMRNLLVSGSDWIVWLLPLSVLIFLQVGAEELFFRGYLLRLIYARRASLLWAVYIPSLLFGLAHFDPVTYGGNAVFYVFNTTVTGVILCFIVLWRGNIGMAMGIHFAVNISAILIVGQDNTPIGSGGAFWVSTIAPKSDTLGLIMVAFTLLEIILYFVWAKRYHGALIPRDVGSV